VWQKLNSSPIFVSAKTVALWLGLSAKDEYNSNCDVIRNREKTIFINFAYTVNYMKQKIVDETIGWYGTCVIVLAYALVSFSLLPVSSFLYQIMNGTGALGLVYISFKKKVYQFGVLNIIWAIIALVAIIRLLI